MSQKNIMETGNSYGVDTSLSKPPPNTIPPMTNPLGGHWDQPSTANILIDDTHAMMSSLDFDKLAEYNTTFPSGVYDGKMWKRINLADNGVDKVSWLCWFGPSDKPDQCSINSREILICD